MSKLERIGEQLNLIENIQSEITIPKLPICPLCENWGYRNFHELTTRTEKGDLIAIAFMQGVACSCAAGSKFAHSQLQWLDPGVGRIL